MDQCEIRDLGERIKVYESSFSPERPSVLFATKDPGSAGAIAPVIVALQEQVNWMAYAENKAQGVLERYNLFANDRAHAPQEALQKFKPNLIVTGLSVTPGIERYMTRRAKRGSQNIPVLWIVGKRRIVLSFLMMQKLLLLLTLHSQCILLLIKRLSIFVNPLPAYCTKRKLSAC